MDDNRFLNNYKKKTAEEPAPVPQKETPAEAAEAPSTAVEAPLARRYEERSGFRPIRSGGGATPPGHRKPGMALTIVIVSAIVICGVAALILLLNRGVQVINLKGMSLGDAQVWAGENNVKLQIEEQYNDQVEENKIVSQIPEQGQAVDKGGFVKLVVSKGHDLTVSLQLPDLMNMSKTEIDEWAAQNFMTKVRITAEYSDDVAEGRVISFQVNDNTVVTDVKRNTPIYIIVSKGKENDAAVLVTVPDFREKTVADSYVFARENGITLTVDEQYDDYAPKGTILSQSVKADEKVKKGTEITLTVSKGKKIVIGDFSSYTKQKAQAVATELGIPVSILEQYSGLATGKFISQSIPADTVYEDGDVLELYYSLGNKVVIGNYVGQTRDALESWAKGLNDQGCAIVIKATYTQSSAAKGTIIYQDKSNTSIGVRTTIKITVSSGKVVFVPDFVAPAGSGYDVAITRDKAMEMCQALNIVPVFVKASASGRLPGEVWYQSIAPGKEVSEGTTITLKYTPSSVTVSVPNFKGKTEAEIRSGNYFRQFNITFVYADTYVDGYPEEVFKQSLPAGTTAAAGAAITLTISPAAPSP